MSTRTLDDLLAVEQRGWESLCKSEGGELYGALMTSLCCSVNGETTLSFSQQTTITH